MSAVRERLMAGMTESGRRSSLRAFVARHWDVIEELRGREEQWTHRAIRDALVERFGITTRGGGVPRVEAVRVAISDERQKREGQAMERVMGRRVMRRSPSAAPARVEAPAEAVPQRSDEEVWAELRGFQARLREGV